MKNINMFEDYLKTLKETERVFKEQNAELTAKFAETDRQMKETNKKLEAIGFNNGAHAEDYFYNSFEQKKIFCNEQFDYSEKNVRSPPGKVQDEYDIVLVNGKSIAIIEIKFKVHQNDIEKVLKKPQTFKIIFPQYKEYKYYVGLASFSFTKTPDYDLEKIILDAGIAVVKQVGGNLVVMDERVKKF